MGTKALKSRLMGLILAMLIPLLAQAQEPATVDVDEYIEQLNSKCPISDQDGWAICSFTMVGDRYALVDLQLPENLSMVLGALSSDNDNVRRLWIKQLKQYGEPWTRFVDLMVEADRRIIINLRPEGVRKTPLLTLSPSDFKTKKGE